MDPIVTTSPTDLTLAGSVVSIGNFDGVHLGHRALLSRMRQLSDRLGLPGVVISFYPTSRMVFTGSGHLSNAAEKVKLFGEYAPEAVVLIPFSREFAATDKSGFIRQLAGLNPSAVLVGSDFRFGRDRQGEVSDLALTGAKVEAFGLVEAGGEPISSSRIRELLQSGDVRSAAELLGRPYLALGRVAHGDRRGRTIGFPTANLEVEDGKVLPHGVYAVTAELDGRQVGGMANVGPRPSFPDSPPALEVNLFDFDEDIYGRDLTVNFIDRLRGQVKFESLDALKNQLAADARAARLLVSQGEAK